MTARKAARKDATKTVKRTASRTAARAGGKIAKPARPKVAAKTATRRGSKIAQKAAVKPVPDGYHTATPYLIVNNAAAAIDYYRRAFGATEVMRFADPSGKVGHAEIKIGDSVVMLADEFPGMDFKSPRTLGGTASSVMLYVKDVDSVFKRAIAAGGKQVRPVTDQFYGDRSGFLEDPFGHQWAISTHKEDVSPAEMRVRMAAMQGQQAGA